MDTQELIRLLKAVHSLDVEEDEAAAAEKRASCLLPTRAQVLALNESAWTDAERKHVTDCRACRRMLELFCDPGVMPARRVDKPFEVESSEPAATALRDEPADQPPPERRTILVCRGHAAFDEDVAGQTAATHVLCQWTSDNILQVKLDGFLLPLDDQTVRVTWKKADGQLLTSAPLAAGGSPIVKLKGAGRAPTNSDRLQFEKQDASGKKVFVLETAFMP